ncbi:MAG: DNA adenine methylase [Polyangiales bacterium]
MEEGLDVANDRRRGQSAPAPFLKWAGGKRQLLKVILPRLPVDIRGRYIEPFLGGGAVFFELARLHRVREARLFDCNEELISTYRVVRNDLDALIRALSGHRNDETHYYATREIDPSTLSPAERAARMIFLNRVGYNGLYRVNASGRFNVPFGRYRNPLICDEVGLRAASNALDRVELEVADFEAACKEVAPGDVVYFDPPYLPLSTTANFTAYARLPFGEPEHRRLAVTFQRVVERGAYALLSNSDTALARSLYQGFKISHVDATRLINSKSERRGVVQELLVQGLLVGESA